MSIIYDALQKTQRNREYFRLQNALTPHNQPHRRNIKWMVLGSLLLVLGVGMGGIVTFYISPHRTAAAVAVAPKNAVAPKSVPKVMTQGAHLWVTDAKPTTPSSPITMPVVPEPARAPVPAIPVADVLPPEAVEPSSQTTPLPAPTPTATPAFVPVLAAQQAAPVVPELAESSMTPPVASTTLFSSNLVLNGVMIYGNDKVALINNQPFHQGDVVDGMKIVDIDVNSIKLQNGPDVVELRVSV